VSDVASIMSYSTAIAAGTIAQK